MSDTEYTVDNFLRFDFTANDYNTVTCRICGKSDTLPTKDQFASNAALCYGIEAEINGKKKRLYIDTPQKKLALFEANHLASCLKVWKVKNTRKGKAKFWIVPAR